MPPGWRIIKSKYAPTGLDGEGSRLHGSRWTSPGRRVVHASQSLSLATLEILVHLQTSAPLGNYAVFQIAIPEGCVEDLDPGRLPKPWRRYPAPVELRKLGDAWLRDRSSAVLRVPSVIVATEFNYLMNPGHADFSRIEIKGPEPFDADPRIFGGPGVTGGP